MANLTYIRITLLCSLFLFSACSEEARTFRYQGVGTELYTSQTSKDTTNLLQYLVELCAQSGQYQRSAEGYSCNPTVQYRLLMEAGFNDIDGRCNRYLTWIDSERTQRLATGRGLSATQTLAAGVLGISGAGADTLAYLALAFGFAGSFTDAVTTSMLMNLESSTIKTIVYKRRQAFREAAQRTGINSQPDLVFALRNYLSICTPQTIVLDVNTFSRGALTGTPVDVKAEAKEQFSALGPLRASAPATSSGTPRRPLADSCPGCDDIFERGENRSISQYQSAQNLLCVGTGTSVEDTKTAVNFAERTGLLGGNSNGQLSNAQFSRLERIGCGPEDAEFQNIWEKKNLSTDTSRNALINKLNKIDPSAPPIPSSASLDDVRVRAAIRSFAEDNTSAATAPTNSQLSQELMFELIRATQ